MRNILATPALRNTLDRLQLLTYATTTESWGTPAVHSASQFRSLTSYAKVLQRARKSAAIGRRRRDRNTKPVQNRQRRFKMGQESSSPVDESIPSQTLKDRTLGSVAQFIRDGHAKNIVVMVGSLGNTRLTELGLTIRHVLR